MGPQVPARLALIGWQRAQSSPRCEMTPLLVRTDPHKTVRFAVKRHCTQTGSRQNLTVERRPPTPHPKNKKVRDTGWQSATKNTLCQHFTCYIRPFGKPLLVKPGSIWDAFWPYCGSKSPENCRVNPPNPGQNASKSPKNGVWWHFGPFEGHFYPF